MNVLFLGNSYTYYNDLPELFRALCAENGHDMQVFSVTAPGRRLQQNLEDDEHTAYLQTLLKERHYDLCILQEQSVLPFVDFDAYLNSVVKLKDMLQNCSDRLMLYATWGRKAGESFLIENHLTNSQMTALLHSAFLRVSEYTQIPISPVGLHFYDIYTSGSEAELYDDDRTHPSYAGSCLAALVHYKTVFQSFPLQTENFQLDAATRRILFESAAKELTMQSLSF